MNDETDYEALYDELVEIICGDKMIGVAAAAALMKRDAERYRWLRERGYPVTGDETGRVVETLRGEFMDQVVDGAMRKSPSVRDV